MNENQSPNMDEIRDKIAKLLRLSTSSNVHEAALAAQRAQEMMDKYKIRMSLLDDTGAPKEKVQDFGYSEPLESASRFNLPRWKVTLAGAIARHNNCSIYVGTSFSTSGQQRRYEKKIGIAGYPSNVQIVRYLYGMVCIQIEQLADTYCKRMGGTYRDSFKKGAAQAVSNMLYRLEKERTSAIVNNEKAIMLFDREKKDVVAWETAMKFRKMKSSGAKSDFSAFSRGIQAGKTININSRAAGAMGTGARKITGGGQ